MSLLGIYKGIEHDDSMEHGQWTDTTSHESLENAEKGKSLESPKLCLGMVISRCYGTPTLGMPMVVCWNSLWVYHGQILTKPGNSH